MAASSGNVCSNLSDAGYRHSMHTTSLGGRDSLYSIVQMPSGIPVATVAINGGANAGLLAAKILATSDPELLDRLKAQSGTEKSRLRQRMPDFRKLDTKLIKNRWRRSEDYGLQKSRCGYRSWLQVS